MGTHKDKSSGKAANSKGKSDEEAVNRKMEKELSVPALDKNLIRKANEAGTFVDYGDATSREYNKNVDEIKDMDMTADERKAAYSQLHTLTENQLKEESHARGAYAAGMGPARFDRQAIQRNQSKAVSARAEVRSFMDDLRRSQKNKAKEREQKALTDAMLNALNTGALEFTVNGTTWRRKSRRGKTFTADR